MHHRRSTAELASLELKSSAGGVIVSELGGASIAPTDAIAEQVLRDYPDVGRPHSLLSVLPQGTMTVGEELRVAETFLRLVMVAHLDSAVFSPRRTKYSVKTRLVAARDGVAEFEVDAHTATRADAGWSEPFLELHGKLTLRVPDGWPNRLQLTGRGRQGFATLAGVQTYDGSIDLRVDWSYE